MNLTEAVGRGLAWVAGARLAAKGVGFVTTLVLARLLFPRDFGLIGMVMVLVGLAELALDLGFGDALVQRANLEERHWQAVFWLSLALGLATCGLLFGLAPWVAAFYGTPELAAITRAVAIGLVIATLGVVPRARLMRALNFRLLAQIEVLVAAASGLLAVGLASAGLGVWSLVGQTLMAQGCTSAALLLLAGWRPALRFSPGAARDLAAYSLPLAGFSSLNYWARNLDNLLIGRFIGAEPLGLYSRAYALMLLPVSLVSQAAFPVLFPALANLQADKSRVRSAYLRAVGLVALVTFPLLAGMAVVASPLVSVLFGTRWRDMAPTLQILAVAGIPGTVCNTVGWIYKSQGRTELQLRWGLGATAVIAMGIVAGSVVGTVEAVAAGYAFAMFGLFYPCFRVVGPVIDLRIRDVHRALAAPLGAALCMAGGVWLVGRVLPHDWAPALQLTVLLATGLLLYGAIILRTRALPLTDLRRLTAWG